jgi:hypothetical protein
MVLNSAFVSREKERAKYRNGNASREIQSPLFMPHCIASTKSIVPRDDGLFYERSRPLCRFNPADSSSALPTLSNVLLFFYRPLTTLLSLSAMSFGRGVSSWGEMRWKGRNWRNWSSIEVGVDRGGFYVKGTYTRALRKIDRYSNLYNKQTTPFQRLEVGDKEKKKKEIFASTIPILRMEKFWIATIHPFDSNG